MILIHMKWNAKNAIIHGFNDILIIIFSQTCLNGNTNTDCTNCNDDKHRIL